MGLPQPSPALPEGCLGSKAQVLKVIKSGTDYINGKGPVEVLSSKVVWLFLMLWLQASTRVEEMQVWNRFLLNLLV